MKRPINPIDLAQINRESLEKLTKADIISLALKLRDYGIELYERLNQNSSNSSRPPSSDSPFNNKTNDSDNAKTNGKCHVKNHLIAILNNQFCLNKHDLIALLTKCYKVGFYVTLPK
jgi:hypothetical protein